MQVIAGEEKQQIEERECLRNGPSKANERYFRLCEYDVGICVSHRPASSSSATCNGEFGL